MKPPFALILVTWAILIPLHASGAPADHVILISVDGFRPEFYFDRTWPAPTIQQMADEGVKAEGVRGVFPTVTYPSHTTMVTGAMPARHGVYYNNPFEPEGQTGRWYWEANAIQVPTLWDAVRAAGKRTGAVSWPVSVGAPIDWLMPEVWSLDENEDRLKVMRDTTQPARLWGEVEANATGRLTAERYTINYMSRDTDSARAAAFILENYRPALLAVHLIGTDHFQHEVGRDGAIVRRALAVADSGVSALVEAAERAGIIDRTAFIITGDHGFVNTHVTVAPNVWLAQAQLQGTGRDRGDWRATFHASGGATFLHLRNPGDREAVDIVRLILQDAPQSVTKYFRLVERAELEAIGANPNVPLALAAGLGATFTDSAEGEALRPASGGTHGYFPTDFPEIYTGFVGWGAGFNAGQTLHRLGLEDIAPIVARLLEIPFNAPDGAAPPGIFAGD